MWKGNYRHANRNMYFNNLFNKGNEFSMHKNNFELTSILADAEDMPPNQFKVQQEEIEEKEHERTPERQKPEDDQRLTE